MVVERGVQSVEGLIRTLMSACQERMGTRIKLEEKIVTFMAEYAAYLSSRLDVGKDGKTAYERDVAENEQQSWPLSLVRSPCGRYVRRTGWKSSSRDGSMECSMA